MANPLTGDFEAILQVSGATINRLMASMHQNDFAKPNNPSFPHSVALRIGDGYAFDGVRGTVRVQVGVPRIELFHGVSDRFLLEVGIRARYKPDAGSKPLPEFIHGTVRAEYKIHDIDPSCPGWAKKAADHIWVRVIRDTVKFTGTAFDDGRPWLQSELAGGQDIESRITRLIARQLSTTFAANPHPVSKQFRRGSMRSLNVPVGGSAVAMPVGISGEPVGSVASINNVILDGADFAIAIGRDTILALAEPTLNAIRTYSATVKVFIDTEWYNPVPDINTVYRVSISPPTIEWHPQGTHAIIKIKASGAARTDSILADATFDVVQDISVNFDGGTEKLWLSGGSPYVKVSAGGLGHGTIAENVKNSVVNAVKSMVNNACVQAQPQLDAMIARKSELINQLHTIDDQVDARVEAAEFVIDGVALRGTISVAGRKPPFLKFDETFEEDGYTAFLSWIPGGRIDQLLWSWTWFAGGTPGQTTFNDRYILRRPATKKSHWGGMVGIGETTPLPGLDGSGQVCLTIKGVRVDRYTGALVPFTSRKQCQSFGYPLLVAIDDGIRLFFKTRPHEPELSQDVPFPELGLLNVDRPAVGRVKNAPNTLLVYADRGWDREIANALREGLERTRRRDAGMQVLVLFREGTLTPAVAAKVEGLASTLGAPVMANEDVRGGWSRAFALPTGGGDVAWRLISPGGGVTWMHDGRLQSETLSHALDQGLIRCKPVSSAPLRGNTSAGMLVGAHSFRAELIELMEAEPKCPPMPLNKAGMGTVVAFAQAGSASSIEQVKALSRQQGGEREGQSALAVVLDGADARAAAAFREQLGEEITVLPDESGAISGRFGIRIWPTTLRINRDGIVSNVELGHAAERPGGDEARVEPIE